MTQYVFISGNFGAVSCTLLVVFSRNFDRQQDGIGGRWNNCVSQIFGTKIYHYPVSRIEVFFK